MNLSAPSFWDAAPGSSLWAKLLSPLGDLYHGEVQRRLARGNAYRASCPVICVGNATMGGVGKTPFVRMLGETLKARGESPHVLTRGYGGSAMGPVQVTASHRADEVGDEPLMLSQSLPIWVSRDRPAGAYAAVEAGASIILMDDGLQNPTIDKSLSLLLVDGVRMFGNGEVFPAGPLREKPEAALARAGAVIAVLPSEDAKPAAALIDFAQDRPLAEAWFSIDSSSIPEGPVMGFCGIGRPQRFEASLRSAGAALKDFQAFPDHHPFKHHELDALRSAAQAFGAQLVTTEKDYVRLAPSARDGITPIPGMMKWRGGDAILRLVEDVL